MSGGRVPLDTTPLPAAATTTKPFDRIRTVRLHARGENILTTNTVPGAYFLSPKLLSAGELRPAEMRFRGVLTVPHPRYVVPKKNDQTHIFTLITKDSYVHARRCYCVKYWTENYTITKTVINYNPFVLVKALPASKSPKIVRPPGQLSPQPRPLDAALRTRVRVYVSGQPSSK